MKQAFVIAITIITSTQVFGQVDTISNLSDREKIWGLTKFYSESKYNFVFFDKANIDWDSAYQAYLPQILITKSTWEYYNVLSKFCALLKDGHTNISTPFSLFQTLPNASRYKQIIVENFNKKLFVTNVPKAKGAEDLLGAEVVSINNEPSSSWLQKNVFPTISASTEQQLWNDAANSLFYIGVDSTKTWQLRLKTPKGKLLDYQTGWHTYRANWIKPLVQLERFSYKKYGDIGYMQINTFAELEIIDDLKKVLPELYNCKSLIIDIRMNGGGNSEFAAQLLKYFTLQKTIIGSTWKTREHQAVFKAWGQDILRSTPNARLDSLSATEQKCVRMVRGDFWHQGDTTVVYNDLEVKRLDQPLIVLQGNNTASAAEDFLIMLHSLRGRAITMGQKSYGSTGQPLFFDMPGGGSAKICVKRDTYPNGKEFVGYGIQPDIEIEKTVYDVINNIDIELKAALYKLKR